MELIGADHALYDVLRKPALPQYCDVRPRAIARCASADDVIEALAYARSTGLSVAPRGGGHCFAGRSSTTGLLLDLSALSAISVDGQRATIGGGARLADVYRGLEQYGLTIPAGCGPTVGIAGLTSGGGLGLLGRRYGLTCDRLVAATVVLADGTVFRCDAEQDADLFWALRGSGGGQFGVVTELTYAAVPSPAAIRFNLTWPRDRAADVIAAWQSWAPDAPDEMTASLSVTADVVRVFGACVRPDFGDLGSLGPQAELRDDLSWAELKSSFSEGDSDDRIQHSKSEFFQRSLARATVDQLLEAGCELNFTAMGGAYNRVPADATAFAHRAERFLLEHVSPGRDAVRRSWALAHPHASGHVYPNFPDPDLTDWATAYYGTNYPRLQKIKQTYDPGGVFHCPQTLGGSR
ncbi:FAD-binding oxidoreductase [Kribbella shirazensis]|uniref:FAD/FMN-containing dehydrogenase n=1 Tax=Kribbella shirazensis TaxID=1105143 RepID=A0A7X5VCT1_9ACTN|nr:FAD-binding oxidoreductase [Kribbella shirazensis]NIK58856.1 FAD/FMN-containing dehydrogenase [Kribbella shirazensis]